MAPHYAISEAFIVLAALWSGWKLFRRGQWVGAIGTLLFGAAAAVGVYRFPSGQVEELANFHRLAGQLGGLVGMALIASELLKSALPTSKSNASVVATLAMTLISLVVAWQKLAIAVPLFLCWSLAAIVAAICIPQRAVLKRALFGIGAALMLLNVIFIRQSSLMSQDLSWHLFHTFVAVWLVLIWIILGFKSNERRALI